MIESISLDLDRRLVERAVEIPDAVERLPGGPVLRWSVSHAGADAWTIELSRLIDDGAAARQPGPERAARAGGQTAVVSIVPTGVGCEVGGYAADAGPATSLLAACVDHLVTNPNAVNGSDFVALPRNLVYTEGFFVDGFFAGRHDLFLPRANRVGVLLGRDEQWKIDHAINVVNAARAVHGVDVVGIEITDSPVGARCVRTRSGAYAGTVPDEAVLLEACGRLVDRGATAIAISTTIEDLPATSYARHFSGEEPNPVGGAEAVVSHLVCRRFGIPAAHAPLSNFRGLDLEDPVVDPRGAAEIVSASGLACALIALARAPQAHPPIASPLRGAIALEDVLAVVAPASALGGAPVLHAVRRGIPVVAVRGNETVLDVTADALGIDVIEVASYPEAAGTIVALREGIAIPSLHRPLARAAAPDAARPPRAGAAR